jgi:endonuclease/exonuclease/phosphatase (EEP) superfamily protein YafD
MSTHLDEAAQAAGTARGTPPPPRPRRRPGHRSVRLLTGALVLWTAFLAAFYALTGGHWWWRPLELMPPLTFAVVPLLLLVLTPLARGARLRLAAAALCCVLLGLPLAGLNLYALPGLGGGSAVPAGALRVFSWNTEYWDDSDDPEAFYTFLKDQRADVYLLQEHVSWDLGGHRPVRSDHRAELRARFPGYHVAAVGEMLTMSRYPIEHWRGLDSRPYLPEDSAGRPPDGSDFPEYYRYKVLRTDLRIGGRVSTFYNVHVPVQLDISMDPASSQFTAFMRAQEERRQAMYRALEDDIDGNRLPMVVAGDMNGTSAMGELRGLGSRLRDALPAADELYPVSWPSGGPSLWRLDWAFTSTSVKVHTYRMVDSAGMSDHRAQALTMTLPGG